MKQTRYGECTKKSSSNSEKNYRSLRDDNKKADAEIKANAEVKAEAIPKAMVEACSDQEATILDLCGALLV